MTRGEQEVLYLIGLILAVQMITYLQGDFVSYLVVYFESCERVGPLNKKLPLMKFNVMPICLAAEETHYLINAMQTVIIKD